jgi:hypothetical protein
MRKNIEVAGMNQIIVIQIYNTLFGGSNDLYNLT